MDTQTHTHKKTTRYDPSQEQLLISWYFFFGFSHPHAFPQVNKSAFAKHTHRMRVV